MASELRLRVGSCRASINTINSKARVASVVDIQLDKWKGHDDFTVLRMDEFEVILGQEFLRRMQLILIHLQIS
jgi:hypothetical protein